MHLPSHPVNHGAPEEVGLRVVTISSKGHVVIEFGLLEIYLFITQREE